MKRRKLTFEAIGTRWSIDVQTNVTELAWADVVLAIKNRIEAFDEAYSRFRPDSLVKKMAKKSGTYKLPDDAYAMLQFYKQMYSATGGSVTPLIGQVVSDAGYDATYSFQEKEVRRPPTWQDTISFTMHKITLSRPALLDFGAAGKGYLVDIVGGLLSQAGIPQYIINAGGDILYKTSGNEHLPVGLENPYSTDEAIGVVNIHNESICASAGSRRAWGKYYHIIDPHTLQSPKDIIATWVVAKNAMMADGLATALYFTDPAQLATQFQFSYALLRSDMSLEYDKDFPVQVFEATS